MTDLVNTNQTDLVTTEQAEDYIPLMIVVYDPDTRLPSFTSEAPYPPSTKEFFTSKGLVYFECVRQDIDNTYVVGEGDDRSLQPRPELPASWNKTTIKADDTDLAILTVEGDAPFKVWVDGQFAGDVTDGTFELSVSTIGSYEVEALVFPYRKYRQTIKAVF